MKLHLRSSLLCLLLSCSSAPPSANRSAKSGPLLPAAGAAAAVSGREGPSTAGPPSALDETGAANPAGLSEREVAELRAGGPVGEVKLLYPYDGTVFHAGSWPRR